MVKEVIVPIVITTGNKFRLYSVSYLVICKANQLTYTNGTTAIKFNNQYNLAGADAIVLYTIII